MSSLRISIVLHPKSIEDIKKDKDTERKKIILSKFKTYALLEDFPRPTTEFYTIIGKPVKQNDIIDSYMLIAVNNNAINFLITEDKDYRRTALIHIPSNKNKRWQDIQDQNQKSLVSLENQSSGMTKR